MKAFFFFIIVVVLAGCTNDKQQAEANIAMPLYLDCRVTGEENKQAVTVLLQFRADDRNGNAVALKDGAKVELNGVALTADSAAKSGAFYEVHYRLGDFTGTHSILYTDARGKSFEQQFDFTSFMLQNDLDRHSGNEPLVLNIEGMDSVQPILTLLTDTAFSNNDINEIDTARNGTLTIGSTKLGRLKSGPVALQLIRNTVKNFNQAGFQGRIATSYALKREFELTD